MDFIETEFDEVHFGTILFFNLTGALMKDADKLKLMLLAWNYNLQQQAQAQAASAALSPNNSSTTTSNTIGTPVTSQSAISTANNTINNSTLTGNT